MAKLISELSVFLPTYNEEENISQVVLNTKKILEDIANKWEIIVVNDGSSDNTLEILKDLFKQDSRLKLINHQINRGYGSSLRSGFYESKYQWVAYTDSDGQFDFSEIVNFIQKQKETNADLVIGFYKKRQVSLFKKITSRMWETAVYLLFGLKVHDIDCGFKFISRNVINTIPHLESERGAFISSELLVKAKNSGFKIVEIPVTHYPRTKGVGTGRNINVIIKSFTDLFKLYRNLKKQ